MYVMCVYVYMYIIEKDLFFRYFKRSELHSHRSHLTRFMFMYMQESILRFVDFRFYQKLILDSPENCLKMQYNIDFELKLNKIM